MKESLADIEYDWRGRRRKAWFFHPRGYFYALGPIMAPSEREARRWWRAWLGVARLYGEVYR